MASWTILSIIFILILSLPLLTKPNHVLLFPFHTLDQYSVQVNRLPIYLKNVYDNDTAMILDIFYWKT